jgi:hypothetical protein
MEEEVQSGGTGIKKGDELEMPSEYKPIDTVPPPRDGTPIFVISANNPPKGTVPAAVYWHKGKWLLFHTNLKSPYDEYTWGPVTHWAPVNWE